MNILTSLHGRRFGLADDGSLVLNKTNGDQELFGASVFTTVSSAQVLALNATPQTVVPALGAGLAAVVRRWAVRTAGGTAYAGVATGEDLVLKYTNGSGTQCASAIETTGFLDQTTAQIRAANGVGSSGATAGDFTPVANSPIVLHLLVGEITTGNYPLLVKVWYDVLNTAFAA